MKTPFITFFSKLSLLTFLIILLALSVGFIFPAAQLPVESAIVFAFFFIITLSIHFILLKADEKPDPQFIRYFMITTMLKLFLYLGFIIILIFLVKEHAKPLAILFMILYLIYSVFEIGSFLSHLKKRKLNL